MESQHWSKQQEAASSYPLLGLVKILFKIMPVVFLRLLAFPVGFCYFLCSKQQRSHSRAYLNRLAACSASDVCGKAKKYSSLKHIVAFALALVEKIEAWGGKVLFKRIQYQDDDMPDFISRLEKAEGIMLISSHLGNMEFIRALANLNRTGLSRTIPVTAIVDFTVTANFDRLLRELNSGHLFRIINVGDVGPETITLLQERIAAGELVVIAADRTSAGAVNRVVNLPFLGEAASFPYGPYFLAMLLDAPLYAVFALRQKDLSLTSRYYMHIHKCPVSLACGRREREGRIRDIAGWFASLLERYCKLHPYQWYNFFDFWKKQPPEEQ